MRILIAIFLGAAFPVLSVADTIEYTFYGSIENGVPGFPNTWNGPGPEPTTFQMTFDVDTLAPGNLLSYTIGPNPDIGPSINWINANLAATNFSLLVDGSPVLQTTPGSFNFEGTTLGASSYIGGYFGAGDQSVGFFGVPDFGLPVNTQAALLGASDPLSLMLNGSSFNTDDFSFFLYDGSSLLASVWGEGKLVVSVPEPGTLALLLAAGLGLGFAHRRRVTAAVRK